MSIAAQIAGLIQVGKARGYSDLSAVYYANNELDPAIQIRESALIGIGAAVHRRLPYLAAPVWSVLVMLVMDSRIIPRTEGAAPSAMPSWAWALIGFVGIMVLTGGLRR